MATLDAGHALIGPVEVRGARAGQTLAVGIDEVRIGAGGVTQAGGWSTPLNDRLGLDGGETLTLLWELDADAGSGRSESGHEVALASVPRRHRHAAGRARHPLDRASAAVRRKHRLQGARRGDDAVPPDLGRRSSPLGRRRARGPGRRRGVAARDRGAGGASSAHALRAGRSPRWRTRSRGRRTPG